MFHALSRWNLMVLCWSIAGVAWLTCTSPAARAQWLPVTLLAAMPIIVMSLLGLLVLGLAVASLFSPNPRAPR